MRDCAHAHRHVEVLESDMAVTFAERTLWLKQIWVDQPLDHNLGVGGHIEVDGKGFRHSDRRSGKPARHGHFIEIDRELHATGEHRDRGTANDDRAGHRLAATVVFLDRKSTRLNSSHVESSYA